MKIELRNPSPEDYPDVSKLVHHRLRIHPLFASKSTETVRQTTRGRIEGTEMWSNYLR
jgi:hypothetical protein